MSTKWAKIRNCNVWHHRGCITPKTIDSVKRTFRDVKDLNGFEELKEEGLRETQGYLGGQLCG